MGAHIETRSLNGTTVEIRVVTYSDPSGSFTDACSVDLEIWNGAGTQKLGDILGIPRVNGPLAQDPQFPSITCQVGIGMGTYMIGTYKRSEYLTTHAFVPQENYILRFKLVGRNPGILNLTNPDNQWFIAETHFQFSPFTPNASPVLLNHTLEMGCVGQMITLNPGAWDEDGDSLAFDWAAPLGGTGYVRADSVGTNGQLHLDPESGHITWTNSQTPGTYVLCYAIREYRDGFLLSTTPVEQLILLQSCTNQPPMIEAITDTTVAANVPLQIPYRVWDPDTQSDSVYFQSNNAARGLNSAFHANPAASLSTNPDPEIAATTLDTISGTISWIPPAVPGRTQPYQIDLVAHDNIGYHSQPGNERALRHHLIHIWVQTPVANDPPLQPKLTLSPNPAAGRFRIEPFSKAPSRVEAIDQMGRTHVLHPTDTGSAEYSTEGLPPGIYVIRLTERNQIRTGKLILQ
ncbi:MAG: T9SS type A sorting domain-containing protein [Bacteroidia bacterium]